MPFAHVVGVVRDNRRGGPTDEPAPDVYFPDAQDPRSSKLLIRVSRPTSGLAAAVEREVNRLDPGLHAGPLQVIEDLLWQRLVAPRFIMFVVVAFSLLALALALVGVHGVLAYAVARRIHEIGIHMALGGSRVRVMRMVLGQAARYAVVGGVAGLATGVAIGRVARALLFQVTPADPTTLAGVSLILLLTVLLAAYGPARRATRVDPIACLREE
jgi:ABC-type antimicrobial peptide transport system permease subunit